MRSLYRITLDVVSVSQIHQNFRKYDADLMVLQVRIVQFNVLNANSEIISVLKI